MKCDMCGLEFDQTEAPSACAHCPMVRRCKLLRCPRCGYEMLPEPKLVGWLRKLGQRRHTESQPGAEDARRDHEERNITL